MSILKLDFGQIRLDPDVGFHVVEAYLSMLAGGLRDKANNENRTEKHQEPRVIVDSCAIMTGRHLKQGQILDYSQSLTCMYYGECGGWTTQTYSSAETSYMKSPVILEGFEPFLKADVGTLQNNKPAFSQLIMCVEFNN